MTIRLDALASWKLVPKGEALLLPNDSEEPRRIRIDLNCEDQTWVYVAAGDLKTVQAQFLGVAGPGLETIEFYAGGDLAVTFAPSVPKDQESQVWLYTAEIEPNVTEVPEAVSFTEIHQRRARNPELEMMQLIARQNERRMDERIQQMEALIAGHERANNDDTDTPAATPKAAAGKAGGNPPASASEDEGNGGEQPSGSGDDDDAA